MFKTVNKEANLFRRSSLQKNNENLRRKVETDQSKLSSSRGRNPEIIFDSMTQPNERVLSTHFNQDCSCIAISTNLGFKVFSLMHPQKVVKLYENKELGVVSLISM